MGIPARFAKAWGTARLKMRQFLVALCFLPAILADAEAEPGYGHRGHYAARSYAPKCHTTYETVTREACTTTYESVCSTETTTNFVTRNEQECSTRSVQECATTVRNVPEEQCPTVSEQQCTSEQECTTETQTVVDTTYTDECQQVAVKHVAHGVYANSPAPSRSIHGVRAPTSYGYGVGKSYTRRDY